MRVEVRVVGRTHEQLEDGVKVLEHCPPLHPIRVRVGVRVVDRARQQREDGGEGSRPWTSGWLAIPGRPGPGERGGKSENGGTSGDGRGSERENGSASGDGSGSEDGTGSVYEWLWE